MSLSNINSLALTHLKKEWMRAGLFFMLFASGGYFLFNRFWETRYALRWLGLTSVFGAWQLFVLWRSLGENHREGEVDLLPTLGWGNAISFARGIFIAGLLGFLFSPWAEGWLAWLPFTFYLFAALSDILDGYLARINNHVTKLGAALDMNNDSWGVLIVTLLVFWYGQVPLWYLPVGLARYFFIFGLWLREKQGKQNFEMPFSYRRRIFAGVQMGFIVSMLAPLFSPPATTIAATLFMIPFLGGFLYDWFLVTGRIDPEKGAAFFDKILTSAWMRWLPLLLRLCTVASLAYIAFAYSLGALWTLAQVVLIIMLIFGILGRLIAILTLIFAGLTFFSILPISAILLVLSTILLFTGTGALSLWSPEEWLIYNRAGEKADV
ncbi:MAG: CDP-alcohol phosphatidyltransferase family protein [Anaerolineae bacterium]|jgi:CDP-diacylglycerol---glycerol-3-phosphate 3-phosphatidyltransferase|nr:CDP-alcohol phosphatidyltransferase family protein [Anaerolineae bacterium]MBT7189626.1 CDP-alcohol phosphatidyltransferase family protein [Anaerolineae bacterium]MBT7991846.1 CDP-alcohol phosphatidyltransferase family protein [Anaerolineae bacterium]